MGVKTRKRGVSVSGGRLILFPFSLFSLSAPAAGAAVSALFGGVEVLFGGGEVLFGGRGVVLQFIQGVEQGDVFFEVFPLG